MKRRTRRWTGAAVGFAAFLAVALMPSLLYGGYAGVLLAGGIFEAPLPPSFAVRALIVFGMAMCAAGVGSLFTVGGAAAGAAVSMLTGASPKPVEHEA
jgi:hypothetical protein